MFLSNLLLMRFELGLKGKLPQKSPEENPGA